MPPFPLRPWPLSIVFGAFAFVFLPLLFLQAIPNFVDVVPYLVLAHAVGLGTTHFFITLAVYLDRENLAHFASSARNRAVYFVAPLVILSAVAFIEASGARAEHKAPVGYFFAGVRLLDFFHVGRQSFGMLQLYKLPSAQALPAWSRRAENAFFVGMALMQWLTFRRGGSFAYARFEQSVAALVLLALFVAIASFYARAAVQRAAPGRRAALLALAYFAMQAFAAAVAVYDTRFYLVALTLHYVEYHAMMAPRCFGRDDAAWGKQGLTAALRRHPLFFYAALFALVIAFELRTLLGAGAPPSTQYLVRAFDGIFLLHYFLEAFLWKLRDPFYRRRLAPLYLEAPTPVPQRAPISRRPERVFAAVALMALVLAWSQGAFTRLAAFGEELRRPKLIESHLRWSIELGQRGELERAQQHVDAALRIEPANGNALMLKELLGLARAQRPPEDR